MWVVYMVYKRADLKKLVFVLDFCGYPCFPEGGKGRRLPYVSAEEIKVSHDLFRCVLVVFLYATKVFS